MEDQSEKKDYTADEAYNPADEYSPLDDALESAAAPTDAPAETAQPAAESAEKPHPESVKQPEPHHETGAKTAAAPAAAQPPQGYPYPPHPVYPYPVYGMPYSQPPTQAPSPYMTGYMPPVQPYHPGMGSVPPYPAAQPYAAYPPPPAAAPAPVTPPSRTERPAASTGTKAYLIILTALMVAMVIAFSIYISHVATYEKENIPAASDSSDSKEPKKEKREKSTTPSDEFSGNPDRRDHDDDISKDPFTSENSGNVTEFEAEITLIEDKGETQQRDDNNEESVGTPDPKAKGIAFAALPSDDKAKIDVQSLLESVVTVEVFEDKITDNSTDILSAGTGTIISANGYIVTNSHVIQNCKHYLIRVILNSGEKYQAKIVGYDTWTDLAVLKIDASGLKPVTFSDSADITVGQEVYAIGSPGGEKFQGSVTNGIVSGVDRELTLNKYVRYIQSDAAISPGSSGGPLCNVYGQVIGINTAKTVATYYEAMTFSIPSATVQASVNDLLHYGYVRGRVRIGFSGYEVSSTDQTYYGIPAGLIVSTIDPNGALKDTDIQEEDIVTAIDGQKVSTFQDVYAILSQHKPGDKLKLSICRVE